MFLATKVAISFVYDVPFEMQIKTADQIVFFVLP